MMQPDLTYVAYVELMCLGFKDAKTLGSKILSVLNLCRNLFTEQPYHQFSLRAIRTILKCCETLKSNEPELAEENIIVLAIRKILSNVWNEIESTIFEVF